MVDYTGAHTGAEVDDGVGVAKGAGTGLVAKTGAGTGAKRTITGTADQITVTDGDGVSGNPTLALATTVTDSLDNFNDTLKFPSSYGAVGDGTTDDLAAFAAAYAAGDDALWLNKPHRVSTSGATKDMAFVVANGGEVTLPASTYFYNKAFLLGNETSPFAFNRTLFSDNKPADVDDAYTRYSDSHGLDINWVSQWGYNELTVGGDMVGQGSGAEIPGGQTRLGRTLASALRLDGSSTGEGDQYLIDGTMGVSQHSRTNLVTRWAGHAAGALGGGQITANTAKVTLYGIGDLVLKDSGNDDVAMWGHVTQLNHAGGDTGDYGIPRYGYFAVSEDNEVDAAFLASGLWDAGIDFSRATLGGGSAMSLTEGQGIYFDVTAPAPLTDGKFHATTLGGAYIDKQANYLRLAFGSNDTLQVRDTRLDVKPSASSATSFRIYGNGTNPYLAAGAVGNAATIGAYTGGSENTSLSLITAAAGVEATALTLASNLSATFFGDVTVQGDFTSIGINDNATTEVLQLGDTAIQLGGAATFFSVITGTTEGQLVLSGGNGSSVGGNIALYGPSHATRANDILLRSGTTNKLAYDDSAGLWTFSADATFSGKIVAGDVTHTANNDMDINFFGDGTNAQSGAYRSIVNIFGGGGQTRHLSLFQELSGDAVVASTYGDLVLRTDSQNASVFLAPHGTGRVNMDNPTYADDSAAGTGGLVAGDVYQTSTGELRIKL